MTNRINTLKQKTSSCVQQGGDLKNLYALKSELASVNVGPLPSMKRKTPKVQQRPRWSTSRGTLSVKKEKLQPMRPLVSEIIKEVYKWSYEGNKKCLPPSNEMSEPRTKELSPRTRKLSSSNSKTKEEQGSFFRKAHTSTTNTKNQSRRKSALEQIKTSTSTTPRRRKSNDVNSVDGLFQGLHGFEIPHFEEKNSLKETQDDEDVEVENVTVPVVLPPFQAQVIDQQEVKIPRKIKIERIFTSYLYSNCLADWEEVLRDGLMDTDTLNREEFIAVRNFVNKFTNKVNSLCRRCKNI